MNTEELKSNEVHQDTLALLKVWREPNFAYVLFEANKLEITEAQRGKWVKGLFTLNVEHRPDQGTKLYNYLNKGWKVIHWANFPKINDTNPQRAQLAKMHTSPNGINSWDSLAAKCSQAMKINTNWKAEKKELLDRESEYQRKLAAYEAEIERLKQAENIAKSNEKRTK